MSRASVGKCLIVIGALIGVVPLAVFFSVPLFALGLFLLWGTDIDRAKKVKWTVVPLLLIVATWTIIVITSKLLHI